MFLKTSTQQIKELEAQRDELLIKIEMDEKAYKNSQEKIRQLGSEIKQLKEENEQLSKFGKKTNFKIHPHCQG